MKKIDKTTLLAIILVIIVVCVIIIGLVNKSETKQKNSEINIVVNYDDFYTVDSCINRTLNYINSSDKKSLMSVLDKNYLKNNNLDSSNVLDSFSNIPTISKFSSKKMYYQRNGNITKFYIYGILKEDGINVNSVTGLDYYFIVNLDIKNELFSIEPIDKTKWDGVDNG